MLKFPELLRTTTSKQMRFRCEAVHIHSGFSGTPPELVGLLRQILGFQKNGTYVHTPIINAT